MSSYSVDGKGHLLSRAIFNALLVLIALAAIPYGTVQPWWEALFECAIFALVALWIIDGLVSGSWLVRDHRLLLPFLALDAFSFMQTLTLPGTGSPAGVGTGLWRAVSADPYQTRLFALKLLTLILTGALLLRYTSSQRRLRALIYLVIGIGVMSALFGIFRQTMQRGTATFVLRHLPPGSGYGQFINRNHFAYLMEMTLGLVLGLIVGGSSRRRDQLLFYWAAAVPVWTALVLANSRGGILSMLAELIFVMLLWAIVRPRRGDVDRSGSGIPRWLRRARRSLAFRAVLIASLVGGVAVGVIWVGGDPVVSRLETVSSEVGAGSSSEGNEGGGRAEIWRATWQLIKAHPIAGVGMGGYWAAIPEYHGASGKLTPQEAHNDYLELLASGGIIGAVIGVWCAIVVLRQALERLRSTNSFRRAACCGALAGIFGIAIHSLVDFGLHVIVNALVFIALVVIATVDVRIEEKMLRTSSRRSSGSGGSSNSSSDGDGGQVRRP